MDSWKEKKKIWEKLGENNGFLQENLDKLKGKMRNPLENDACLKENNFRENRTTRKSEGTDYKLRMFK